MEESGWKMDVSHSNNAPYTRQCGNDTWFGYRYGYPIGVVKLEMLESGNATLNFGYCYPRGQVIVYLNDVEIAAANANTPKQEIAFKYSKEDSLKIKEVGMAIIKLNSFNISCDEPQGNIM